MLVAGILVFISFVPCSYQYTPCPNRCEWLSWDSWGSCSQTCGGGYRTRSRQLCCRTENGKVVDTCNQECGKTSSGYRDHGSCNEYCHNGGHFHYENTGSDYTFGHCICSQKYAGDCCDIPKCGWDGKWCWPGTCWLNYESYCNCDSGFSKEAVGSTTKCQLSSSSKPTIETCRMGLETRNRDAVNTTTTGRCDAARSVYTNLQPSKLSFTLESSFNISVSSDPKSNRIGEWRFGVVQNAVTMVKKAITGQASKLEDLLLSGHPQCNVPFSDRSPRQMVSCTGELTRTSTLQNGESICINFKAYAGGYLKSKDPVIDTYKRTEKDRELCFMFDNSAPVHCLSGPSCKAGILHIDRRITESPNIHATFSSWTDPLPAGGSKQHASGISNYLLEVLRVDPLDKFTLVMKYPSLSSVTKRPSESSAHFTLTDEPALYAIVLEVHDTAGNVQMARRFVLFDNSSTIALFGEKHLWSTTASSKTNYTWQIHHSSTCFNWTGRYYNTYHLGTNLLRPIKHANSISSEYDQLDGPLPISGTPNVNGIIRFEYTWKLNNQSYQPFRTVSDVYNQSFCEDLHPSDGQSYTFKIKPIDINSRILTEEYMLHVDRSPPDIDNMWLLKDGYRQLFIHNSSDLSQMVLQFEALDIHSGLRTIHWGLGTSDGATDIGTGFLAVNKIDGPCSGQDCYCPNIGRCEKFIYTINLNGLVANNTHKGQHNREYFFTLAVTNNARLINIEHLDILADDSPPAAGIIIEGDAESPDIDYTSENEMIVSWSGFVDHESGIKLYRLGIASECLSKEDLYYTANKCTNISAIQETQDTAARFTLAEDGFFRTSVVAYNHAMEPSKVVCSDGFYRDSSKPFVSNVTLKHNKVTEILACDSNGPWLIRSDLKKIPLPWTDICVERCADTPAFRFLENLEVHDVHNNDTDIADDLCLRLPNFTHDWFIYIPSNKIEISWISEDKESQIRSEEIGFASDPSMASSPDLEAYHSTNGRSRYHNNHEGIDTGNPFFISVRVTNKANMATLVSIGPIIIDDTPPEYTSGLQVHVDKVGDKIYCSWSNYSFIDTEQRKVIDFVIFRIGSGGRFYTPMLQVPTGNKCSLGEMYGCVDYPLHMLQRQDEENGLLFYFELYVYNMAEHFITVRSDSFYLPSRFTPGYGSVLDVDPSSQIPKHIITTKASFDDLDDVNVHFVPNVVCAAWAGFYHHQNVSFEIGVGTTNKTDNIIPFLSVSSNKNFHCFNSSKLLQFVRYFMLVRASCSAGSVTVTSDGITILDQKRIVKDTNVHIGSRCNSASSEQLITYMNMTNGIIFKPDRKLVPGDAYTLDINSEYPSVADVSSEDVLWLEDSINTGLPYRKEFRAVKDMPSFLIVVHGTWASPVNISLLSCAYRFHSHPNSQLLSAFWDVTSPADQMVDAFHASLFQMNCKETTVLRSTDSCLTLISGPHNVNNANNISFTHLSLIDKVSYVVAVQLCFGRRCLPYIYSSPVFIQYLPPAISFITASIVSIEDSCVDVDISWRQSECGSSDENTVTTLYQWTLALSENAENILTPWKTILHANKTKTAQGIVNVRECAPISVYAHRLLYSCVKTMCLSGAISTSCAPLKTTPHPNDYRKSHLYEVDANSPNIMMLKSKLDARFLGESLKQLQELDIDFCRRNMTAAGVLACPIERNVTWYLTTFQRIPRSLNCELDTACLKSVSTQGGFVVFRKFRFIPGTKYFICAFSNATTIHRELFDERLEEIKLCGNGFIVDEFPPTPGKVTVVNQRNGFLLGSNEVIVAWDEFIDSAANNRLLNSSIKGYSLAIGTSVEATDVQFYKPVGLVHHARLNNLRLTNGKRYFVSVRATDQVGLTTVAVSAGVTIDTTSPITGSITVGGSLKHRYLLSKKHLTVHWTGFADHESGIDDFYLGIGYQSNIDNVKPFTKVLDQFADLSRELFDDGRKYYAVLRVSNKAGLWSTVSSQPFILDSSPPTGGVVRDGENTEEGDVDFQNYTGSFACHWDGFYDPHSDIYLYRVGLGTAPNMFDIFPLTGVGIRKDKTWYFHLIPGIKYFVTVEACNGAGLCSRRYSDGVVLDDSPPIPGLVHVGISSGHEKYQSHRNSISAQWMGFEDPHSGLHHFEWCLTTVIDHCNLVPFSNVLLSKSLFKSQLKLPLNQDIYVRLKAFNNVGMATEALSNSFQVDDTAPQIILRPRFRLRDMQLSNRQGTQWDKSLVRITWKFSDSESPLTKHIVQLHTHHDGKAFKQISKLGNENHVTLQTDEKEFLKNGDRYTASVTACNAAGLCSSSSSVDLLIDSSPPHMGGFKPPMTWINNGNNSEILVSWYGFSDVESDIDNYFITVSRHYSKHELSNGVIVIKANNRSEQNMTISLTQAVQEGDLLILSVWATNFAGLRSAIGKATVSAVKTDSSGSRGILRLQKHSCVSHFCNNDCTCAVVGKKCEPLSSAKNCIDITGTNTSVPSVKVLVGMLSSHQNYTASSSCLSGHWSEDSYNDSVPILRYEWSMGLSNGKPGEGVFESLYENVWYDVGLHTNVTYCLPFPRTLVHDHSYIVNVKAWYSDIEYKIFASPPVHVDTTPPGVAKGHSVYESVDGCKTDVEFLTETIFLQVCWQGVFIESQSQLLKYELMAGSFPYGDDLLPVRDYGMVTNVTFTNLNLYQGTRYYFTIRAVNAVGLQTSLCSDGLVLDTTIPYNGVVFNTKNYWNTHFQSSTSEFGVSWYGFGDHHSHIHHFSVRLADAETNDTVGSDTDVGIRTSVIFSNLALIHGHTYRASVKAWDAAGHSSDVISSQHVSIDSTPPLGFKCTNFSEVDVDAEEIDNYIGFKVNLVKETFYSLNAYILDPVLAPSIQVSIGEQAVVLAVTETAEGTMEAQYAFMSSYQDNVSINISFINGDPNTTATVKLLQCMSKDFNSTALPVTVTQTGPYQLSVSPRIMDPESGVKSLLLGIGTTSSGYQVLPLSSIPSEHQTSIELDAMHGSVLYTTVIAYNHAGLRSVFHGRGVTVDHTPPELLNQKAVLVLSAVENSTGEMLANIYVHLKASDNESGVKSCKCHLDNVVEKAYQQSPDTFTDFECVFGDMRVIHGTLIKTSVRCVNNVELASSAEVEPLTVSFLPPSTASAHVELIPYSEGFLNTESLVVPYDSDLVTQDSLTHIQAQWFGFEDKSGVTHYRYSLIKNETVVLKNANISTHSSNLELKGLSLTDGDTYTVEVEAINKGGVHSKPVRASIRIYSGKPQLSGHRVKFERSNATLVLDWGGVFIIDPHMLVLYDVNVGTRNGYSDILAQPKMKATSVRVPIKNDINSAWVSVRATYVTGKATHYRGAIAF